MRRRGLLVPVLLIISLMLVLCLASLSRQPYHYHAARAAVGLAQARSLAEMGLENFRLKWNHDLNFPPLPSAGSGLFTYSEQVNDPITSDVAGSYVITVDERWRNPPYEVLRVTSDGRSGPAAEPVAHYKIQALLDLSPVPRAGRPLSVGQWMEWRELSP